MRYNKFALLVFLSLLFVGCGEDEETVDSGSGNTGISDNANLNANIAGSDRTVSLLEIPRLDQRYDYISHCLSDGHLNYALEYSPTQYHSHWVAYHYDALSALQKERERTDAWAPEPYYDNNRQYQLNTNKFSGYQRGHLVGSAERYYSTEANMQTFYMSNMSPMIGAFNGTYWGVVEDKVRDDWGRKVVLNPKTGRFYGGTLYVVKGGTIQDGQILTYCNVSNTFGESVRMVVPKYYFIACLFIDRNNIAQAIGFWMEHKDYRNTSDSFLRQLARSSACSIDELEKKTGIDFFCNLPDKLENNVESVYNIELWDGL